MKKLLLALPACLLVAPAFAALGVLPIPGGPGGGGGGGGGGGAGGSSAVAPPAAEPDPVQLDDLAPEDPVRASTETSAAPPPAPTPRDARRAIEAADAANARAPKP